MGFHCMIWDYLSSNTFSFQVILLRSFPLRSEGGLSCVEGGSRPRDEYSQSLNHDNAAEGREVKRCKATICAPFSLNEAAAASWITAREPV